MASWSALPNEVAPSFGYYPRPDRIDVALDRAQFARALVLDAPVKGLFGHVTDCRVLWQPGVDLPEGVYWFDGVDAGPIILHVGIGAAPGQAMESLVENLDDDHPLVAAWGWAEELWDRGTSVPSPQFAINEPAVTCPGDVDVVVRDRKFLRAQWSYTVLVDGRGQEVLETSLRARPKVDGPITWIKEAPASARRFGATLTRAKLLGKFSNTLFSFRATKTTFRPYQFKPVMKLLQTGKARLLIADEVGLGKTIEAGLIWTELEARQEAGRVLIVCPSSLVSKWKEEMENRFGFELAELDMNGLRDFLERHRQNRLPRRHAYICSLERLRSWDGLDELRTVPPEFDLVIVDEAHSMRNRETRSYALGTELAEWAENLIFLSATPINLREEDLSNLLELLAPEDFGSLHDLALRLEPNKIINAVSARLLEKGVKGRELVSELGKLRTTALGGALVHRPDFTLLTELLAKDDLSHRDLVDAKRYLAELNTLSTVITRTKKVEVDEKKAKRTEDRQSITWTQAEDDFYTQYVEWCRDRADSMGRPLYFAMQMPLRLASACLPMARRAVLDPEGFGNITDADEGESFGRLEPHTGLVLAAQRLPEGTDSKFDALQVVLSTLNSGNRRALLFTHSRPTLRYLSDRLGETYRIAVMHGGVGREQRQKIMASFRAGEYDFVLANRVASEGLDFEFCSAVINYDLPWNPMEIEQRIGRIDRIGQQEETILVVNFVNERTIDERILGRLLDRIQIFESSIGAAEPIIAATATSALKSGFNFALNADQREQRIHEALTAIEAQRAGLEEVSDASSALLVSNDVDVAGLEDDLLRTGRYIGQQELAHLLDDWARVDDAGPISFSGDGQTVEFVGNARMAARIDDLARAHQRTHGEIRSISSDLRSELPMTLVLNQEIARKSGGRLLAATSPLVTAAASVPSHRHSRFASLRLDLSNDELLPGTFVVVMAKSVSASRGGDEIWGAAIGENGRDAGDGPFNALMAALAEGRLFDGPQPAIDRLDTMVDRAMDLLNVRHADEQIRRDHEFSALQDARAISIRSQHDRKIATIDRRIETARSRDRDPRSVGLFESQRLRADERFARLVGELESATHPEIRLEPLAVCVIHAFDRAAVIA